MVYIHKILAAIDILSIVLLSVSGAIAFMNLILGSIALLSTIGYNVIRGYRALKDKKKSDE